MVSKITEPDHVSKAIRYNEHKVGKGDAKCIFAANFLDEAERLTLRDKVSRFTLQNALHKTAKKNTLHISLNFDPSEKIAPQKLIEIASDYIEGIGFGGQPFLVYEHYDASHPHIHIVVNNIRGDGTRIDFHNIGRNESEAARKAIEKKYGLIRAEDQERKNKEAIHPLDVKKLLKGKSETKQGITNVLHDVLAKYKFSSLAELNAILFLYNVRADPGTPGGRQHVNKGLVYHLLDEQGKATGKRIKASAIYFGPTLAFLEDKFKEHSTKSRADIRRVKSAIDWIMQSPPRTLEGFIAELKKEQVHTVVRKNEAGMVYGLTFVDSKNKSVLNGSEIDKGYSAKNILEKCGLDQYLQPLSPHAKTEGSLAVKPVGEGIGRQEETPANNNSKETIADVLMDPEDTRNNLPWELRNDRKKKKNNQHLK